jgi:hypothetical protein
MLPSARPAFTAVVLALVVTSCGGGSSSKKRSHSTTTADAAKEPAPPPPRLVIRAPRRGSHTSQTLTVRVALLGRAPAGATSYRYVLDGRFTRHGSTRVTFDDLAPGRHHLVVTLLGATGIHASDAFTVRAPPPPPPPVTATSAPPAPAPAMGEGIVQGNGGDMDGDNNGGPSDGDGGV